MLKSFYLPLVLVAVAVTGCSKPKAPKYPVTVHFEKVTCQSTDRTTAKTSAGLPSTTVTQVLTVVGRRVQTSPNGLVKKISSTGEVFRNSYDPADGQPRDLKTFQSWYTYQSNSLVTKAPLPGGLMREVTEGHMTQVRQGGPKLRNKDGQETDTDSRAYSSEVVTKVDGAKAIPIVFKTNGVEQPVRDEVITTTIAGNVTTVITVLQKPYLEKNAAAASAETVNEVSETTCRTEVLK